jgi:hypothetical protein
MNPYDGAGVITGAQEHLCGLPRSWWEAAIGCKPPRVALGLACELQGRAYSQKNFRNKLRLRRREGWRLRVWTPAEVAEYHSRGQ